MLRNSDNIGVSELGDVVRTTVYQNVPIRECSHCPMLFIDTENSGNGYCALYSKQLVHGEAAPGWCRVVEVTVKERFDGAEGTGS